MFLHIPRASPGQNSEAAHPANRKRRLLGTRHGHWSTIGAELLDFWVLQNWPPASGAFWEPCLLGFLSSGISCARRLSQLARVT